MPTAYKVLGQSAPAAATLTTLYTVPASTQAVCSTLVVGNRGVSATYRIAIRPGGASIANQHYIVFDAAVNQYDSAFFTLGISLAAGDVVSVYASTADVSFSLFGAEIA
jgi:hypothetical protein